MLNSCQATRLSEQRYDRCPHRPLRLVNWIDLRARDGNQDVRSRWLKRAPSLALIAAAVTGQIDVDQRGMIESRALKLANVRAIEAAEFRFQPGFNLIVGVNGVGKTYRSWMRCVSVCPGSYLSTTESRVKAMSFSSFATYVAVTRSWMQTCRPTIGVDEFRFVRATVAGHFCCGRRGEYRQASTARYSDSARLRERAYAIFFANWMNPMRSSSKTPMPLRSTKAELKSRGCRLLRLASNCIFFSTNRVR